MIITKMALPRRTFLRGLGTTLSLPLLDAMFPAMSALLVAEVLPAMYWRKHHLPGALNMPPNLVRTTIESVAPDHDTEIVLYCWDDD